MGAFHLTFKEKIAILEFDDPDSKANLLNSKTLGELREILKELAGKPKSELEGLLIASRKGGVFISGADIKEIERMGSREEAKEKSLKGKEIMNSLEKLDIPTVAVINGACIGGGLELALACKYRTASFRDEVKLGLPEVQLGLIPGLGGIWRLPKRIGIPKALSMILSGRPISSREAYRSGLVDQLFPEGILLEESIKFVESLLKESPEAGKKKKRRRKGFLEKFPFGRSLIFRKAKKEVLVRTNSLYPAPLVLLEVMRKTYGKNPSKGEVLESEKFAELAISEGTRNLMQVFLMNEAFKKYSWVEDGKKSMMIEKGAIVGAGVMGGGIAQVMSYNQIPTRIKDLHFDPLKRALVNAKGIYEEAQRKRKLRGNEVEFKLGLISPTTTYQGFENADIVIEAASEELEIKEKIFKELSMIVSPKTIVASNTSSLPIEKLSQFTPFPDRVVGMHFFNPVHRNPLVEIIRTSKTSDETLATVISFARRLGKEVIVVKDGTGFLINRILFFYMNEGGYLLENGMRIEEVDRIAKGFGMAMGPLELADEVGMDIGYKVARNLENAYGGRMEISSILYLVKKRGFFGRKSGRGFYIYQGKKKEPNQEVYSMIPKGNRKSVSEEIALKRMIYPMVNEGARCIEEKVTNLPRAIDFGMIMGTGFPPIRGGLLRYADSVGVEAIVKDLKIFEREFGFERFHPCDSLLDLALKNGRFYSS